MSSSLLKKATALSLILLGGLAASSVQSAEITTDINLAALEREILELSIKTQGELKANLRSQLGEINEIEQNARAECKKVHDCSLEALRSAITALYDEKKGELQKLYEKQLISLFQKSEDARSLTTELFDSNVAALHELRSAALKPLESAKQEKDRIHYLKTEMDLLNGRTASIEIQIAELEKTEASRTNNLATIRMRLEESNSSSSVMSDDEIDAVLLQLEEENNKLLRAEADLVILKADLEKSKAELEKLQAEMSRS